MPCVTVSELFRDFVAQFGPQAFDACFKCLVTYFGAVLSHNLESTGCLDGIIGQAYLDISVQFVPCFPWQGVRHHVADLFFLPLGKHQHEVLSVHLVDGFEGQVEQYVGVAVLFAAGAAGDLYLAAALLRMPADALMYDSDARHCYVFYPEAGDPA